MSPYYIDYPLVGLPRLTRLAAAKPERATWRRWQPPNQSQSIWQDSGGTWHSGAPSAVAVSDAQVFYQGGRLYELSSAEADALTAAGYTVYVKNGLTPLFEENF